MSSIVNLLNSTTVKHYGNPHPNEIHRKTVVAAVYNPDSQTFLCQYWPKYSGLTCLLSGGVEESESELEALKREIKEETGFLNYSIVGTLGGRIYSHYYKQKTDEHFVKELVPYLVILDNLEKTKEDKEDDELFNNLFKSSENIIRMMSSYEDSTSSTLGDHKEILGRAIKYLE